MMFRKWLPLAAIFFTILQAAQTPRLVVFIVVDQLQQDLLEKYDPLFTGGYRWILDHGLSFTKTHHEHGYTVTGTAHMVLSSGQFPKSNGVIGNAWYDRTLKRNWNCVEDPESKGLHEGNPGRSIRFVKTNSLGDWLKKTNLESKVVSIAGKDRAAILLGGQDPDLCLWYNKQGSWTSSTYYMDSLPEWVKKFNRNLDVASYSDSTWNRILKKEIYDQNAGPDERPGEYDWAEDDGYSPTMPIPMDQMSNSDLLSLFYVTPWGDRAVLDLAELAIGKFSLGTDENPDILFLGLTATDGVGHEFGPNSHEQLDNYLRLDRNLGRFINAVDQKIGLNNALFVLTSDHGAVELPESLTKKGVDSGRISKPERNALYEKVEGELRRKIGSGKVIRYGNFFYFSDEILDTERDIAVTVIKKYMSKLEGIASIITKNEIVNLPDTSFFNTRLKNMIYPQISPDVFLIPKKYWTWRWPRGSSHGTPYDYDTHVPLIFAGIGYPPQKRDQRLATVDIAPTVAVILNIPIPKNIDGNPIRSLSK